METTVIEDISQTETRSNQPVTIVEYTKEEDMYSRKEPSLSNVEISPTGEITLDFSSEMVFPEQWT